MTLLCVPIFVDSPAQALADAIQAAEHGADLVEFRIDRCFDGSTGSDTEDAALIKALQDLIAHAPLPVILTCRPTWEGGEYDGDDADRVALFEKLTAASPSPPAYLDVELAAYTRSANLRQKINLCVAHDTQQRPHDRPLSTRLILSTHDFQGRPADLTRKLAAAYAEPAAAIVKVAFRARSLRDNLELFDILAEAQKPTIALGMGEFGLMSRVLAPKFGGFLTFASLRDTAATAPGQPTLDDMLNLYRFRSINKDTKLYGVIGWPVTQSMSPLIHNASFAKVGHNGVYLPLPVVADENDTEASYTSFKATVEDLYLHDRVSLSGVSVTIPHKVNAARLATENAWFGEVTPWPPQAINTLVFPSNSDNAPASYNTDQDAIDMLLLDAMNDAEWPICTVVVHGTGGVARAAIAGAWPEATRVYGRNRERAERLVADMIVAMPESKSHEGNWLEVADTLTGDFGPRVVYINCTPLGMTNGPDPSALSIPIPDMLSITPDTVFFDTVYNPIETPMLKAARERGCRTIDGVQMFVKQAAAQFELWTGKPAPEQLFDRLVRAKLSATK